MLKYFLVVLIAVGSFFGEVASAESEVMSSHEQSLNRLNLNQLEYDQDGYLASTGTDSFWTIDLNQTRADSCYLSFDASFKEAASRPRIFELFWSTKPNAFSKNSKAFIVITPEQMAADNRFVVPLCKLYGFSGNLNKPSMQANLSGIRFDYPPNEQLAIKFHRIELFSRADIEAFDQGESIHLEPIERISSAAYTSADVFVTKLVFAFEDGIVRLGRDKVFLIFWLISLSALTFLFIRSFLTAGR